MIKNRFNGPLEQISTHCWRIPRDYKPNMRVEGLIYASEKLIEQIRNDQAPEQVANVACIPGIQKTNFLNYVPKEVRQFKWDRHYVVQPAIKAGDVLFFTEALIHGTKPWVATHQRRSLLYKYSPGHSAWNINYYDIESYGELTERQRRMLQPPSIGKRPRVDENLEVPT